MPHPERQGWQRVKFCGHISGKEVTRSYTGHHQGPAAQCMQMNPRSLAVTRGRMQDPSCHFFSGATTWTFRMEYKQGWAQGMQKREGSKSSLSSQLEVQVTRYHTSLRSHTRTAAQLAQGQPSSGPEAGRACGCTCRQRRRQSNLTSHSCVLCPQDFPAVVDMHLPHPQSHRQVLGTNSSKTKTTGKTSEASPCAHPGAS